MVTAMPEKLSQQSDVRAPSVIPPERDPGAIEIERLDFAYGDHRVLHGIDLDIAPRNVTALIGPSGCGKTTLLRCINRMNDLIDGARITSGAIRFGGKDINAPDVDVVDLRRRVGMVFQKSNPFPKSIYDNVAYGLRVAGVTRRIARALAVEPDVILMDEPCSALDPIATARIEELIQQLKRDYTIVIVTHNMQQAGRCSDQTAFFYLGRLIEYASTAKIFSNPAQRQTEDYITGRFG